MNLTLPLCNWEKHGSWPRHSGHRATLGLPQSAGSEASLLALLSRLSKALCSFPGIHSHPLPSWLGVMLLFISKSCYHRRKMKNEPPSQQLGRKCSNAGEDQGGGSSRQTKQARPLRLCDDERAQQGLTLRPERATAQAGVGRLEPLGTQVPALTHTSRWEARGGGFALCPSASQPVRWGTRGGPGTL